MSDVTYEPYGPTVGGVPANTVIETETQISGAQRQVVKVGNDVTVNGTVAVSNASIPITAAALPLPTGAATSAAQTNKTQMTQITDGSNQVAIVIGSSPTSDWSERGLRVYGGPTDIISNIPVSITYDHHQLHEGEMFRWSTYTASLANNANKDIRLVVPNITIPVGRNPVIYVPHLRFEFISSLGMLSYLYEAPTTTANGTQRTPVAMERNGTYTPKLQVWEDPTVTAVGTLLWQGLSTTSKNVAGDTNDSAMEFVLRNNTTYLLRGTSTANSNQVLIRLMFYEDLSV